MAFPTATAAGQTHSEGELTYVAVADGANFVWVRDVRELIDEDDFVSVDDALAPTQQSTRRFVSSRLLDHLYDAPGGTLNPEIAATSLIGDVVETAAYYQGANSGATIYEVVAAGTGTDDGGAFIDVDASIQLKALFGTVVHSGQYGAIGDGIADDTVQLERVMEHPLNTVIDPGTYLVAAGGNAAALEITQPNPKIITFADGAVVKHDPADVIDKVTIRSNTANCTWDGVTVDGSSNTRAGLWIQTADNTKVRDANITNLDAHLATAGIRVAGSVDCIIDGFSISNIDNSLNDPGDASAPDGTARGILATAGGGLNVQRIEIRNGRISDVIPAADGDGIAILAGAGVQVDSIVHDVTLADCAKRAIKVQGSGSSLSEIRVTNYNRTLATAAVEFQLGTRHSLNGLEFEGLAASSVVTLGTNGNTLSNVSVADVTFDVTSSGTECDVIRFGTNTLVDRLTLSDVHGSHDGRYGVSVRGTFTDSRLSDIHVAGNGLVAGLYADAGTITDVTFDGVRVSGADDGIWMFSTNTRVTVEGYDWSGTNLFQLPTVAGDLLVKNSTANGVPFPLDPTGALRVRVAADVTKVSDGNATTTASTDPLEITGLGIGVYEIEAVLMYESDDVADFRSVFSVESAGVQADSVVGFAPNDGDPSPLVAERRSIAGQAKVLRAGGQAGQVLAARYVGQFETTVDGGSAVIRWAQNTANATNTTLKAGSYLKVLPIPQ